MYSGAYSPVTLAGMSRPAPRVYDRLRDLVAIPEFRADPSSRPSSTINEVFTGEPLAEIPAGTADDVVAAVERARAAQVAWAERDVADRVAVITRFAKEVMRNRAELMDIVQAETGKSRSSAQEEVLDCLITARHYARTAPGLLAPKRVQGMLPGLTKAVVRRQPKGVVGVIAPWNYPLNLAATDALAALIAGNAVVIKPASITPFCALAAADMFYRAGLPRELFQVVPGAGGTVGGAIVDNVDYLMFTGSTATGRTLGRQCGERLIGFSAELGGKNAMIVTAGADLDRVAEVATRAFFSNSGQLCISVERLYVEKSVAAQLTEKLTARVKAMSVGPGYDFEAEMGSLISQDQLDTVSAHVDDAVSKGARVLAGGRARPDLGPLFYEPTLLADVPEDATCYGDETFGPVVSIYPVDSVEEAIAEANKTEYGLNSSVFAATDAEGEAIAARLRTGTVNVGEGYVAGWGSVAGPMGGMGASGVGRRHGDEGLLKYTEAQTIATQRVMHMGGPSFLPRKRWQQVLAPATNAMRFLPGR